MVHPVEYQDQAIGKGWQRRRLLAAAAAACATGTAPALAQSPQTLTFTRIGKGPELTRMEEALRAAYDKLELRVDFIDLPAERAMLESNAGRADGETARVAGMEAAYPHLRMVDVPLYINTNSIFVHGAGRAVPSSVPALFTLKRVGIVRGWKASEDATQGWTNVVPVTSYASALQMLKLGRLDAFLGRGEDTFKAMRAEGLDEADFPNRVVLRFALFHYLHQRHEALLPAITRELRRIKGGKPAVVDSLMNAL